jgi:hypothetical protein
MKSSLGASPRGLVDEFSALSRASPQRPAKYALRRLEDYLGADLIYARVSRACYFSEVYVRHVADGNAPLGVVEGVERLESELEAHSLRNGEVLEQSRVPVVNARRPQDAAP